MTASKMKIEDVHFLDEWERRLDVSAFRDPCRKHPISFRPIPNLDHEGRFRRIRNARRPSLPALYYASPLLTLFLKLAGLRVITHDGTLAHCECLWTELPAGVYEARRHKTLSGKIWTRLTEEAICLLPWLRSQRDILRLLRKRRRDKARPDSHPCPKDIGTVPGGTAAGECADKSTEGLPPKDSDHQSSMSPGCGCETANPAPAPATTQAESQVPQ